MECLFFVCALFPRVYITGLEIKLAERVRCYNSLLFL